MPLPEKRTLADLLKIYPYDWAVTQLALDEALPITEILKANPNVNTVYNNFALTVHEDFRGQGLATKLATKALSVGKMVGCDATWVVTSSNATRKIFNRLGVGEWKVCQWEEMELEGGLRPFKDVRSDALVGHFAEMSKCILD